MKLEFLYDRRKDAENWVKTVKDTDPSFGISYEASTAPVPDELRESVKSASFEDAVGEVLAYFDSNKRHELKEEFIAYKLESLGRIWRDKGARLIEQIEQVFGKLEERDYKAYLTTLYICDYSYEQGYFYLSLYHSLALNWTVTAHELSHFVFYRRFREALRRRGVSEERFQDLKEASSVLLNTEGFEDLLLIDDSGYEEHEELRQEFVDAWSKEKDLEAVVDELAR